MAESRLQRIRGNRNDAPFIVVTGFGTTEDAVLALRLHAADFLEKPVFNEDC